MSCCGGGAQEYIYENDVPFENQAGKLQINKNEINELKLLHHPYSVHLNDQKKYFQLKNIGILYNPSSCLGKSSCLQKYLSQLDQTDIKYEIFETFSPQHLEKIVIDFDFVKFDALAVCGGDGTQFMVINAIAKRCEEHEDHIPQEKPEKQIFKLIVLPGGTGNDLYKSIGPIDFLKPQFYCMDFDIGKGTFNTPEGEEKTLYFAGQAGIGLGGNGNARARKYPYLGAQRYDFAAFMEIIDNNPTNVSMDLDGVQILNKQDTQLVQIHNIKNFAGGMKMAPFAQVDDGLLDITFGQTDSRLILLEMLSKIKSGQHVYFDDVFKYYRAKTIKLYDLEKIYIQFDGELYEAQGQVEIELSKFNIQLIQ